MSEKYIKQADLPDGWHLGLVEEEGTGDLSPRWVSRQGFVSWQSYQGDSTIARRNIQSWGDLRESSALMPCALAISARRAVTPTRSEDFRLVALLHRADECETQTWRQCDPEEVDLGWLVESRFKDLATRGRVTEINPTAGIWASVTEINPTAGIWASGVRVWPVGNEDDGWTLWTTEPAPTFSAEEEALRDLLGSLLGSKPDDDALREVIAQAKAIGGAK